ncbi:MAG: endonuclease IV, partial [Angelakisella sp.]|nr:endonuclease IV [Angelakisella sp.]
MIWFGPAGNAESFAAQGYKNTIQAPKYLYDMGLNAYEYQCGRGVRVNEASAQKLKAESEKYGIRLSLHAPYYISLSSV